MSGKSSKYVLIFTFLFFVSLSVNAGKGVTGVVLANVTSYQIPCEINLSGNWQRVREALGTNDQGLLKNINEQGPFGHPPGTGGPGAVDFNNGGSRWVGPRAYGVCESNKIIAAHDGTVSAKCEGVNGSCDNLGGYVIRVKNATVETVYAHAEIGSLGVAGLKNGDFVQAGRYIGTIGASGDATGPHIHFWSPAGASGNFGFILPSPPYRGQFVGQSFQSTMTVGSTQRVQVQLRNTGTANWDGATRIVALPEGASPFYDPSWIAPSRIAALGAVPPGSVGTFDFIIRAPSTPGQYRIDFAFLQEGVAWFSEPSSGTVSFSINVIPSYRGDLVGQSFQRTMTVGSTQRVQVQLRNTGTANWDGATRIVALPEGASPFYDPSWIAPSRIAALGAVPPGSVGTFDFIIRAPSTPGQYRIDFAFLQEGVAWFSEPNSGVVSLSITVSQEHKLYLPSIRR